MKIMEATLDSELFTSKSYLTLPSPLVHHPVLNIPSLDPSSHLHPAILLRYPTSILCHGVTANHTYQMFHPATP